MEKVTPKQIERLIPGHQRLDFIYFLDNVFRGTFSGYDSQYIIDSFYRWYDNGAIKRSNASHDRWRIFVDVPYPKNDDFKRQFRGRWSDKFKCWYIEVTVKEIRSLKDNLYLGGYNPIVIMDDVSDVIQAVYDPTLARSKFSNFLKTPRPYTTTDRLYTG